jgi:Flp pilus assembly CpaF family ATPase
VTGRNSGYRAGRAHRGIEVAACNLYTENLTIEQHVNRLLPIAALLRDPSVQEISINSGGRVYVDRGSAAMQLLNDITIPDAAVRAVIRLLMAAAGGYLDPDSPFANLTLACGARFSGAVPPVSDGAQLSIRTHRRILRPLSDFMDVASIALVSDAVKVRKSIVIGGATSTGKTTLLNSLIELIPHDQRLLVIEDAPELQIDAGRNVVRRLATRGADLRRHVFESLRYRPDWIIVGETRDQSACDLLDAARTGHPGMSTVHASSADGIVTRLMSLANCDREFVREAIDLVLFVERMPDGRRAVSQIKGVD